MNNTQRRSTVSPLAPQKFNLAAIALWSAMLLSVEADARQYFVDEAGNDQGEGTKSDPLATIQRAAELAQPGDIVSVREGVYRESIRPGRSGTAGAPIVFEAYEGEDVLITGADPVDASWSSGGGTISTQVDVSLSTVTNQASQVFVDEQMYFEARWPNTLPQNISTPTKATVDRHVRRTEVNRAEGKWEWVFEDADLANVPDLTGARIYIQPSDDTWSFLDSGIVTAHNGARLTYLGSKSEGNWEGGGTGKLAVGARYYVFGPCALLDGPGEWCHDGSKLHLSELNPNEVSISVKRREFAFDLSERSHIVVRGFRLFANTITTDTAAGDGSTNIPSWRQEPPDASQHIVIDSVHSRYPFHATDVSGHMWGQWGQNSGFVLSGKYHKLLNSSIQFSSANGVSVLGIGHEVANNLIYDTNYSAVEAGCIGDGFGTQSVSSVEDFTFDQEWHHNTCLRTGRSGLQTRNFRNSDRTQLRARIHHNVIGNYGLQDFDVGAFYSTHDGAFARFDHNVFYLDHEPKFMDSGIYFDVAAKNYIVDHNVVYNVWSGVTLTDHHGFENILVYNNTVSSRGPRVPKSVRAGGSDGSPCGSGCLMQNNLFKVAVWLNPENAVPDHPINQWPTYGSAKVVNNLNWGADPNGHRGNANQHLDPADEYAQVVGFEDLSANDYRLTADSPAVDSGTTVANLRRNGVAVGLEDAVSDGKPDMGAYEHGAEPWRAGSMLDPIEHLVPSSENGPIPGSTGGTAGGVPGSGGSGAFDATGARSHGDDGGAGCACRLESPSSGGFFWTGLAAMLFFLRRPQSRG